MSKLPTHFPSNPSDGDRISDINGIIYQYDKKTDTWVECGVVKAPPVVTKTQDGLVSPELYRKLNLIKILKERGINWNAFQLATSSDKKPYFYYFNSSDDLIKFIPEGTSRLRIEVDKARLYNKLLSLCCVGPKGEKGQDGDKGDTGKPGTLEPKRNVSVNSDGSYHIEATINTPIDTEISIRFFNNKNVLLVELLLSLDNNLTVIPGIADIETTSSSIELTHNTSDSVNIIGDIVLTGDEISGVYYKARQRGPVGKAGKDGTSFIEVIEDIFSDSDILSTEAIIAVRKSGVDDNLTVTKQDLFVKNIFSSITGVTDFPLSGVTEDKYFALRVNTDDCKDIGKFQFKPDELVIPDLDLPDWTPTCNCTDTFRYQIQKFDWYKMASDQVPFSIIQEPAPDDACCQEDFFWCPNQGDLCSIGGAPKAPSRLPMKSETRTNGDGSIGSSAAGTGTSINTSSPYKGGFVPCPIPDPNGIELNGQGKQLGSINGNGEIITESVITNRGKPDIYTAQVEFEDPNTTFTIHVDIQIGHADGTFDGGAAFTAEIDGSEGTPTQEQIDNQCALHSSIVVLTSKGAVSTLLPSPNQTAQHDAIQNGGNSIVRTTYTGKTLIAGTVLDVFVNANDTLLDCCLSYAVRIIVESEIPADDVEISGGSSGSGGSEEDEISRDSGSPPEDNPFISTPPSPPVLQTINVPEFGDDELFVGSGDDIPVQPDYRWRPVAITRPVLVDLAQQMEGMLIGETLKTLTINANFTDKIQIIPSTSTSAERSVIFPVDGDPANTQMIWNTGTIEFDRNGSFLENGPLGPGFYFLQLNQFTLSTKYTKLGVTTRTDIFDNGFMYISGNSIDDDSPSSIAIVANGVDWTINQFAESISGFGSNWIKRINRGIEQPGDALFQIVLDSEDSLIRKLFYGEKFTIDDAFMSVIYNPFGCATLNIPATINSTVGNIVGGRNGQNCMPLVPSMPGATQTATIQWDAVDTILDNTIVSAASIAITLTTSDGLPLVVPINIAVEDVSIGVTMLLDWDYTTNPNTIVFNAGTPNNTTQTFDIVTLASSVAGSVTLTLMNTEAIGDTSAVYTLTDAPA